MPAYPPELHPAEGIWPLLKRAMVNFAAPGLDHLVRIIKRKLKKRAPGTARSDTTLWCWGYSGSGQLGIGGTTNQDLPQQVTS